MGSRTEGLTSRVERGRHSDAVALPLVKPDVQISRIRLSDKTSRLRPRLLTPPRRQTYEPKIPVQVREWIAPALLMSEFVFEA